MITKFALHVIVVCVFQEAWGQFPVELNRVPSHFYEFGPDFGDFVAPVNDDGSTTELSIEVAFPFYNHIHNSLFVSTNGAVSFLQPVSQYTPDPFPLAGDRRLIAPYWTDVDTRNHGGRIYYQQHFGTGEKAKRVRRQAKDEVEDAFRGISFTPDWVFVVTWYRVTCYVGCFVENTFQAALITDGIKSFVSFHYGDMSWTAGTASGADSTTGTGGTPAVAGFNAGDGIHFEMIPDSRTEDIVNISSTSNIDEPGAWLFRVDSTNIQYAGCTEYFNGPLHIGPRYASSLGGKRIFISGPCYNDTHVIQCKFGEFVVDGRVIDSRTAECIAPLMGTTGTFPLTMSLNGGEDFRFHGQFLYVNYDPTKELVRVPGDGWLTHTGLPPQIRWDKNHLNVTHVNITFVMFSYDQKGNVTTTEALIKSNVQNVANLGEDFVTVPIIGLEDETLPSPSHGAIRVSSASISDEGTEFLWTDIHDPTWYIPFFFTNVASNSIQVNRRKRRELREDIENTWNEIKDFFDNVGKELSDIKERVEGKLDKLLERFFTARCDDWVVKDNEDPPDFSNLPAPPCTLNQARNDPNFKADSACNEGNGCGFHAPDAYHCVRSRTPSASGASQQACYAETGELLTFQRGGGTVDRSGVTSGITWPFSVINHFLDDVEPFFYCCRWSNNCAKYSNQRPTHDCTNYIEPQTATGFGDPHVFTLDGFEYTFNGLGEYVLLQMPSMDLVVQARTSQAVNGTGFKLEATEWSALVMKMSMSSTIQIQVDEIRSLVAFIDGVIQEFDDVVTEIGFNGGSVSRSTEGNSTVFLVVFSGITFQIKSESTTRLSFIIQLDSRLKGDSEGLLGVWNDDETDDLLTANGTTLTKSSPQEVIFHEFGESWRITENTSLFYYEFPESYSTLNKPGFRPVFPSVDDFNSTVAADVCGDNRQCLFDYHVSGGDVAFAQQTMQSGQIYQTIIRNTQPVITCGFPTFPTNANVSENGSLVGAVVEFTCEDGYVLSGTFSIFCQQDGTWSSESPVCQERVDSDEDNQSLLIIIICSSVAGTMVVALLIVGLAYKCSTKRHQKSDVDKQADPQVEKTTGVYINTRIPRSHIGYVGPYPHSQ